MRLTQKKNTTATRPADFDPFGHKLLTRQEFLRIAGKAALGIAATAFASGCSPTTIITAPLPQNPETVPLEINNGLLNYASKVNNCGLKPAASDRVGL
ncbi:MAG: hypothetical protein Q7T16_05005 [Candidatus Burarchaeum sp.]|nr:hypothetical protein [Candidatus Burarchaeum sp.]MDO8339988.1 hypothetical protein [Candidatus Burarchaeum sp.]